MTVLGFTAMLLTLASVFGIINLRLLRMPNTIGVLVIALAVSLVVIVVNPVVGDVRLSEGARRLLGTVNLPAALMDGVLSLLLFAGSLHVDIGHLWERKWTVLLLAVLGTLIAVALLGGGLWLVFSATGSGVPLVWCMVLAAMLAPTDPVAVVGMLKRIGLPPGLQAIFAGESLFNDGVGVVLFSVALGVAMGDSQLATPSKIVFSVLREAVGGGAAGLLAGWVTLQAMKRIDDYNLELTLSLALATGIYSLANAMHLSGPIAVVFAGLVFGSQTGRDVMSDVTHQHLMTFWSLVDELLNTLLFLLIGLAVLAVPMARENLVAAAAAIPLALTVRGISVFLPTILLHLRNPHRWRGLAVLTWGGLRGGISVALALALPEGPSREAVLTVCYAVVVFSIIVQGLTMEPLARRLFR